MPLRLGVGETVAGHRPGALDGGGGGSPSSNTSLTPPPPPAFPSPPPPFQAAASYVLSIACTSAGGAVEIAAGADDGTVAVLALSGAALRPLQTLRLCGEVYGLAYLRSGDLAAACGDGACAVWTRRPSRAGPPALQQDYAARAAALAAAEQVPLPPPPPPLRMSQPPPGVPPVFFTKNGRPRPPARAAALRRADPTRGSGTGTVRGLRWHNLRREGKGGVCGGEGRPGRGGEGGGTRG